MSRHFIPLKKVSADSYFELMYLVRKYEKQGWKRGVTTREAESFKSLVCYMTKNQECEK